MKRKGLSILVLLSAIIMLAGCRGSAGVKTGSISVKIYEATTAANAPQPIQANATVSVFTSASGSEAILHRQLLKPNGNDGETYLFDGLPPNTYKVRAEAPGYSHPEDPSVTNQSAGTGAPLRGPQRATLTSATERNDIQVENGLDYEIVLYMQKTNKLSYGVLKGKVTGLRSDGTNVGGIPDVIVSVLGRTARTDSSGNYRIEGIQVTGELAEVGVYPPQDGTPLWKAPGEGLQTVIAEGGIETILNIQLEEYIIDEESSHGTIMGVVEAIGDDDKPIFGYDFSQVDVYIYRAGSNIDPLRVERPEASGKFSISDIPTTRFGELFRVLATARNSMNDSAYTFQDPLLPSKTLSVPEHELILRIMQGTYTIVVGANMQVGVNVSNMVVEFTPSSSSGTMSYSENLGSFSVPANGTHTHVSTKKLPFGSYNVEATISGNAGPMYSVNPQATSSLVVSDELASNNVTVITIELEEESD